MYSIFGGLAKTVETPAAHSLAPPCLPRGRVSARSPKLRAPQPSSSEMPRDLPLLSVRQRKFDTVHNMCKGENERARLRTSDWGTGVRMCARKCKLWYTAKRKGSPQTVTVASYERNTEEISEGYCYVRSFFGAVRSYIADTCPAASLGDLLLVLLVAKHVEREKRGDLGVRGEPPLTLTRGVRKSFPTPAPSPPTNTCMQVVDA